MWLPLPCASTYVQESARINDKPQVGYLKTEEHYVLNSIAFGFTEVSANVWGVLYFLIHFIVCAH